MTKVQTQQGPILLPKLHDPELLIFVRHGQTDWNAEGRMQGQRDVPLNAIGEQQAAGNGERLNAFLEGQQIGHETLDFVSSPLGRTRATMELLRKAMGLDPSVYRLDDQLKELTFGEWEGFTLEELADEEQDRILRRRADKWGFVPPSGESYEMLAKRIGVWLKTVEKPSVIVSHGGVFRVLRGMLEGLDVNAVPRLDVPQDKVFVWRNGRFQEV
ncbi:histidine phosphatase family protein [Roseibium salinum]|uniref:Phosphoglycerate mutase family protein n=1 Tax=Roseibium salinum TaxID=1604349 RepID=A0ABT3R3K7_9HYPH|nr:histidine phosphatase family protein [Roseibium sp. DSM 29163]MCX2723721.1 phosphoglycerate mutase family protein [Roseibium sp. DSM 29163]